MEDNWSRQADEVEALSSIFCDQFTVDDEVSRRYLITIRDGREKPQPEITLQVTFPPDYPSDAPPTYQINAPWLRGEEKIKLANSLDEIYCDNIGESVVFKWTEKIREFLEEKSDALEKTPLKSDSPDLGHHPADGAKPFVKESEDGDKAYEDEYGFNPELHTYKAPTVPDLADGNDYGDDIALPPIYDGEFVKDRKSVFQGHLAPVTHKKQVTMVLDKLKENRKIAAATHNIIAYRIECGRDSFITGCEDDGEIHAGSRMLHLLSIMDARNVMVIVTRWYGGIHLGPDRFKHINNCTRELLEAHGYVKDKMADKKGPKSRATGQESQGTAQGHNASHGPRHGKKGK